jgi:hypothetical protein
MIEYTQTNKFLYTITNHTIRAIINTNKQYFVLILFIILFMLFVMKYIS